MPSTPHKWLSYWAIAAEWRWGSLLWLGYHLVQLWQRWQNFATLPNPPPSLLLAMLLTGLACALGVTLSAYAWQVTRFPNMVTRWGLPMFLILWWLHRLLFFQDSYTQLIIVWQAVGSIGWLLLLGFPAWFWGSVTQTP